MLQFIVGVYYAEGPPVPIPNTVVKLTRAENSWRAASRENRSTPTSFATYVCRWLILFVFVYFYYYDFTFHFRKKLHKVFPNKLVENLKIGNMLKEKEYWISMVKNEKQKCIGFKKKVLENTNSKLKGGLIDESKIYWGDSSIYAYA